MVASLRRDCSVDLSLSVVWSACAEQPRPIVAAASANAARRIRFFMLLLLIRFGARPVCRSSAPVFKFCAGFRLCAGVFPLASMRVGVHQAVLRRWYALRSILSDRA